MTLLLMERLSWVMLAKTKPFPPNIWSNFLFLGKQTPWPSSRSGNYILLTTIILALSIGYGVLLYFSSVNSPLILLSAVSQSRTQAGALCREFSCVLENITSSLHETQPFSFSRCSEGFGSKMQDRLSCWSNFSSDIIEICLKKISNCRVH